MRKIWLLPALAVAMMASQAWAQAWAACESPYNGYCKWGSDCHQINKGETGALDCESEYNNCKTNSTVFNDAACTSYKEGNQPDYNVGCCKWATGCWKIKSPTELAECQADAEVIPTCLDLTEGSAAGVCPGGGGGGGGGGGDGQSPILQLNPNMGLVVAAHGRALHISSDRNATVTLYTLGGQKVLSGTVSAGNKVFSLMSQNPGVYYAVVQSGSYTQTVNVVLK